MKTDLRYNIGSYILKGMVNGVAFEITAFSGGRGGTTTKGAENYWLMNNAYATSVGYKEHVPGSIGGTLPMGKYKVYLHESRDNRIRLIPFRETAMHGRNNMLIHGPGPIGSQGCIVIPDRSKLIALCEQVNKISGRMVLRGGNLEIPKNTRTLVLEVYAEGTDLDKKFYTA